ncbi:MAG TPA: polysaccharide deacetylase family protein [Pyrinomonadaceae bacterium]|nr:polysaccharide deacetylase family protein [Pyrinomonadaceae bacterium]
MKCRRCNPGVIERLGALLALVTLCAVTAHSQSARKEIAVTFDDLPLNGPRFELARLQTMTSKLLSGIQSQRVPVVGFVNESLVYVPGETDARIDLLRAWAAGGVELGNHTFAHVGFKDTPLAEYEDDFVRGETITKAIMAARGSKPRFFRHPFLQMGPTQDQEQAFETFIAARGYRIAPVTIDIMDWMFRVAYVNARNKNDVPAMNEIANQYLKFADAKFDFCERVATELFGRSIKHILLLHANELNADNLARLMKVIKDRGYQFITLSEALTDPIYRFPQHYRATSDWLSLWSFSEGKQFSAPLPPASIQKIYADSLKPTE